MRSFGFNKKVIVTVNLSKGLFKLGDKKGRLEVTYVGKVVKIGRTGVFPDKKGKIKILKCPTKTSGSARGLPSRQCCKDQVQLSSLARCSPGRQSICHVATIAIGTANKYLV
jgi:hypothetical protein